jgi:hypothetical protein
VGVVIGVLAAGVELVNRDAAGLAEEQLGDLAVFDREHRCAARAHDVDRFMRRAGRARLGVGVS